MTWFTISGYILGLICLLLAIVAWVRPRRPSPRLAWTWISSIPLVTEAAAAVRGLRVTFRGNELERLTMWTGKIWNSGPGPIRGEDLRSVRLYLHETDVFGAWVSGDTTVENRFQLVTDSERGSIRIAFDYLNPGDGAEFTILHSGSQTQQPVVGGTLVGGKITRVTATEPDETARVAPWIYLLLLLIGVPVSVGFLLQLLESEAARQDPAVRDAINAALFSTGTLLPALLGFLIWLTSIGFFLFIRFERRGEPASESLIPRSTSQ